MGPPPPPPFNMAIKKKIGKRAPAHGDTEAHIFFSLNSQVETHILAHAFHRVLLSHMKNPAFPVAAESEAQVSLVKTVLGTGALRVTFLTI